MSISSPPSLPVLRQPSPLSFALSADEDDITPTDLLPSPSTALPSRSTLPTMRTGPLSTSGTGIPPPPRPPIPTHRLSASSSSSARSPSSLLPIAPSPDSLLFRSTISQLDSSTSTLKRLSKAVLAQAAVYTNLLESVGRAEDELLGTMCELGVWLEAGSGLGSSLWDGEAGVRRLRKGKWRAAKEEVEVLVEGVTKAIRGDLKRQGLASAGAHERYERLSKQYYAQTATYLSQNPGDSSTSSQIAPARPYTADAAQAARAAQFDLARYSHHSTLLYALPPSSVTCLDMLVKWYTWIGGILGDSVPVSHSTEERSLSPTRSLHAPPAPSASAIKDALANSLAQLGDIRGELLSAWGERNVQTSMLEEDAQRLQNEADGVASSSLPASPAVGALHNLNSSGISSSPSAVGIEHKRIGHSKKHHRVHRSVGGKLWDMISHNGTSPNLAALAIGERSRSNPNDGIASSPVEERRANEIGIGRPPPKRASTSDGTVPLAPAPVLRGVDDPDKLLSQFEVLSTSPRISQFNGTAEPTHVALGARVMGVGGMSGAGDEDERREAVGRKKEGVLWGAGVWDELGKNVGKAKWEKFWVVLDRSKIYEYRDHDLEKQSAHATIDLKFASVREGRGTDRRFVFEIVTPTKGRRLYQATNEQEMKQWLYAICNAIEGSINGTSSVRTFDASKLRTPSGSLDDHALPARTSKLFPGLSARPPGSSIPAIPATPGNRRSMPPLSDADAKRLRKTSIKKLVRQGAEFASGVLNPRGSLDIPRTAFLAPDDRRGTAMKARVHSGGSSGWSSTDDGGGRLSPSPSGLRSSIGSLPEHTPPADADTSWSSTEVDADGEIEKRVLEMSGLGIISAPSSGDTGLKPGRRIQSESVGRQSGLGMKDALGSQNIARSRSHEPTSGDRKAEDSGRGEEPLDMKTLRAIADQPGNGACADCGKSMKSSRWATLNLRDVPMVMFLCIRCVGHHRGLGTHISKPRSVDLDIWTPESIASAKEWGNVRGNAVWEALRPAGMPPPSDEAVGEYIKAKYVEGRWLAEEDRARFKLPPSSNGIGRAI